MRPTATAAYVNGSMGRTSYNNDVIKRVIAAAATRPTTMPMPASSDALADDAPLHVAGARAEREPNRNLAAARRHRVRQHAVEPDNAEHERRTGGRDQHDERERRAAHRAVVEILHGAHGGDRQIRVHGPDGSFDLRRERRRARERATDRKRHGALGEKRLASVEVRHESIGQ